MEATLWRFDMQNQLWEGEAKQSRSKLPDEIGTLTVLTWNPGAYRQRLEPGLLIMKSVHFGMYQEVGPGAVGSLKRARRCVCVCVVVVVVCVGVIFSY